MTNPQQGANETPKPPGNPQQQNQNPGNPQQNQSPGSPKPADKKPNEQQK
jgi:hypothetical protein